jgi:hypothetical protein
MFSILYLSFFFLILSILLCTASTPTAFAFDWIVDSQLIGVLYGYLDWPYMLFLFSPLIYRLLVLTVILFFWSVCLIYLFLWRDSSTMADDFRRLRGVSIQLYCTMVYVT